MDNLLTRREFQEAVMQRDHDKCVVCNAPAVDAHHIIERRLWPDGGYYLDNGVALCETHHMQAEQTLIMPDSLRIYAGITKDLLPDTLAMYEGETGFDKWGNAYLSNGMRSPGELFYDESVQKVLAPVLDRFVPYIKYPRTPHLPWSPGYSDEDINWKNDTHMLGREVVVTEKMDGENTTLYRDHIHARSMTNMSYHMSRTWVKNLHGAIAHDIPEGWRICGENMYAVHSLKYEDLASYFLVFSIWDGPTCLSWDDTIEYAAVLGLTTVPELYRGVYTPLMQSMEKLDTTKHEGYVVRPAESFRLQDFRKSVAKYVRANHINSDHHWIHKHVEVNHVK